jgi:hypothetical protein
MAIVADLGTLLRPRGHLLHPILLKGGHFRAQGIDATFVLKAMAIVLDLGVAASARVQKIRASIMDGV